MPSKDVKKVNPTDVVIQLIKEKFKDLPGNSDKQENEKKAIDAVSAINERINTNFDMLINLKLDRIKSLAKDGKEPDSKDTHWSGNSENTKEKFKEEQLKSVFLTGVVANAIPRKGINGYNEFVYTTVPQKLNEMAEGVARDKWGQEKAAKEIATSKAVEDITQNMKKLGYHTPAQASIYALPLALSGKAEGKTK